MGFGLKAQKQEILEVVTMEDEEDDEDAEEDGREIEGFRESGDVGMMVVNGEQREIVGFIWGNLKGIRRDLDILTGGDEEIW